MIEPVLGCEQCRWSLVSPWTQHLQCQAPELSGGRYVASIVRMREDQCGPEMAWFEAKRAMAGDGD